MGRFETGSPALKHQKASVFGVVNASKPSAENRYVFVIILCFLSQIVSGSSMIHVGIFNRLGIMSFVVIFIRKKP